VSRNVEGFSVGAAARERLPNRRVAETFDLEALGLKFRATIGRHPNGKLGEIFLSNHRVNSMAGIMASDAAVLCSLLLQYGVPLDVIRKSLMRDRHGKPSGPLTVVLDRLAEEGDL
jgi:hypothetical protein